MPDTWKTIRVFISSTFRDMHAERDHLIKIVFPALRERLEKHRILLVDIDLRWGVTREQAENDRVLDLCLQQIDECRPFFLGILGERYGWVPTQYPVDAVKKFGWIQHHTGKSVTELEILHGVLQDSRMRGRAFFYFRDPVAVQPVPEELRQAVFVETDRGQIEKLEELKEKIRYSGYPVMESYPARWDAEAYDRPSRSRGRLVDLDEFGERVLDQLWQAVREEYQLSEQPAAVEPMSSGLALADEEDYHDRFMESRLRVYVGRKGLRNDLARYAEGGDKFPCLVTGASGSGKSAALARFARVYKRARSEVLVISHFVGASPRSTNLREMLRRFCQVLKERFGFAEEVPDETAKLSVTLREFLAKVPADARVLLVIDALNQLDEADRAQELYWLPNELPPHVKVIVSCISDSDKTEPVLEAFRSRSHCPVQVAALSDVEQREIIRQVPSLSAKTLDDDQVRLLLSNPATANPLFLLVALEELRGFAPYERLNERIADFPCEGDTVTAIFTQVIERLEEEFDRVMVHDVLTLLACARRGLSERELQELLVFSNPQSAVRNPQSNDLFPVLRQLRPYLLSRAGLIDFYHRNLFKAVRECYLPSEEQQRQAHARLAEYFHAQGYWLESLEDQQRRAKSLPPTPRPANVRKVDELPWQLLQAADWQGSEQLLTDLAFLEAKAEAGMVFDLAADFSATIERTTADRRVLRIMRLLEEALRRDIHFIARHPTTLFQCLWNSCWWYDCPELAKHCVETTVAMNRQYGPNETLCELLNDWRRKYEIRGLPWIRTHRPPHFRLGSSIKMVIKGHIDGVTAIAVSPSGRVIISGGDRRDQSLRLWDATTGQQLQHFIGHTHYVTAAVISPDETTVLGAGHDCTIRQWDLSTARQISCFAFPNANSICDAVYLGSGRTIACAFEDKTVRVVDARTGQNLHTFFGHDDGVTSVAGSPDGSLIVSGSFDTTVRVWSVKAGRQTLCMLGHDNAVTNVAFSPDGRYVSSASFDGTVRIWDTRSGAEVSVLKGHKAAVFDVAYSPDGRYIVSCSADATVRTWDALGGHALQMFCGHDNDVVAVAFCPDNCRVVCAAMDWAIRVWDVRGHSEPEVEIRAHKSKITCIDVCKHMPLIVTGGANGEIVVWDGVSGVNIGCLAGHSKEVMDVKVSPDGRRAISLSRDDTVRVWDVHNCIQLTVLDTSSAASHVSVHFARDGRYILTRIARSNDNGGSFYIQGDVWNAITYEKCELGERIDVLRDWASWDDLEVVTYKGFETYFDRRDSSRRSCGSQQAWFPMAFDKVMLSASERICVGAFGHNLQIFSLEGIEKPDVREF